ncbi:hypothetical protein PBCV1_a547R [Paramecium bursaria Chlorella virus 1]|uniref:Uncharacterized protein n=1 Tax=Paramecium bursaria Chlorella virus 1 TaxID=10506 RepID=O41029_PBCV1|nr:hypothetical protein PBCV1_a547R [Paramecium bursaria Chlorella virus 1]AAC96995.1 hypothetical protein [Paramecium bursaria Chlorella virus 1]
MITGFPKTAPSAQHNPKPSPLAQFTTTSHALYNISTRSSDKHVLFIIILSNCVKTSFTPLATSSLNAIECKSNFESR